jgi:hypothetical protein
VASGPVGGVPVVQSQVQVQGVAGSFGTTMLSGVPATAIATARFLGSVVVVTTVAPSAVALFRCETTASVPGLATRMETLTLRGDSCTTVAFDWSTATKGAEPAAPVPGVVPTAQTASSGHCARSWAMLLTFSRSAELFGPPAGRSTAAGSIAPGSTAPALAVAVFA